MFSKCFCMKSYILESWNPPILSRHVSSLTMPNFDAYRHILKKFQRCPHSLLNMRGPCMTFFVVELEVPSHFKRSPTNILHMEMMNYENETSIINVDENMDDLKDYVGTSNILESWNPPILSRHVSSLTMSNFDAYMHSLKKFHVGPIHCSLCEVDEKWHWWWVYWKCHDISRELRKIFYRWK